MTEPIEQEQESLGIEADDASDTVGDDELDPKGLAKLAKARREAASLRARLHAAEEQLGAAAARETARDKAEVERIASEHLVDPTDVWRQQPDLQSYYDEEFAQIVPDKVRDAVRALTESRPHLAKPNTAAPPSQRPIEGLRPGATPESKPKPISWSAVIRGA